MKKVTDLAAEAMARIENQRRFPMTEADVNVDR
jgi:hypothetical protein